jgi:hypothetical protein
MTYRPHQNPSGPRRLGKHARRILIVLVLLAVAVLGLRAYDYVRINLWISRDAGQFGDYPVQLVRDKEIVIPEAGRHTDLDKRIVEELSRNRNVVNLSRLEIKENLLGTRAYAKVLLETAAPDNSEVRSTLKLVCIFRRNNGAWTLAEPPREITLE